MTQIAVPVLSARPPARRPGFRPDVEGLRALALGLVLLYQAGVPGTAGGRLGVDVFFVISGFLITGLLVREVETTGRIDLPRFYARRARRILPSAVSVSIAVLLIVAVVAPATVARAGIDAVAASLQVANWRYVVADLSGLNPVGVGSPLLHYWSLAVEEQFYLAWPPLVVLTAWLARRRQRSLRRWLAAVAGGLALLSLGASVFLTPLSGTVAYLSTPTRAWQLAAGALLALAVPALLALAGKAWWPAAAAGSAVLGLAMVLTSAHWTGAVDYPGSAALVPTLGTVVLIASGVGAPGVVQRLLSWAPVQAAGRLSYVWYLWHLPVIYVAEEMGVQSWLVLLGAEVLIGGALAWLTAVLIERPCRFAPRWAANSSRGLILGAGLTALGVLAGISAVILS
ncbi:acyltransferase family protein [Quadrisphaera setariae]|uniref:acyltransferase family protein n=1 Tax=Quadrisphaera setariae TaxID=2593304 RepID=UPI00164F2FA6|nr:acyltransferase [Quadrisphaera setariae]